MNDLLQALVDKLAVQELITRYAKARDTTDAALYERIFAPDAAIAAGNGGKVLSADRTAILAKVATDTLRFNPGAKPGSTSWAVMRHVVSNVDIELAGDTATADYYVTTVAHNEAAKRPEIISLTRNEDRFERRDGRWWIVRSTLHFGWENDEMGKALRVGPYTPPEYRR